MKSFLLRLAYLPLLVLLIITPASAQALSGDELDSLYNDTLWYAPSLGSASGACLTGTSPGKGAPDGAQFPNLDPSAMAGAIDKWITQENPRSELKGLGATIVATAKNSNVNPFLIVAIAHEESSLSDPGDYNVSHGNNSFGRGAAPGQPSFQGARAWYYWSSVKASVDYTAAENKAVSGGGDMGTYLRNQYGSQLDSNNLTAMFLAYAPPSENNTQQYIANVQGWIQDLINLTGQSGGTSGAAAATVGAGGCSSNCSSGSAGNAAILCEAQKYKDIYYQLGGGHQAYSTFRQACPEEAIAAAAASSSAADPGPCATDCSGLVSVAVDAAFGQNYVWTVTGPMVGDGAEYWQSIPIAQAQAGDIVTTSEHVEIVERVSGSAIYTFGSHHTGTQTGEVNTSLDYWSAAYRWTGPGSS